MRILLTLFLALFMVNSWAQSTQTIYLSGTGATETKTWDFFCSKGRKSGNWTKIEVPSCWEQQGFGDYNYGHDKFEKRLNEEGTYRYQFDAPKSWKNQNIEIVFDGVMTDALVKINGKQAGPIHQGAFYQFRYNISKLLKFGKKNQLEVLVKKHSDNKSVSLAERKSDYWIFGGIFRPVFLEVKPKQHIQRVAIDAKADGSFNADVYLPRLKKGYEVEVQILQDKMQKVAQFSTQVNGEKVRVKGSVSNPKLWNSEYPNLYSAKFILKKDNKTVHVYNETFGFRTIEFREMDGIYVNGTRVKLKGVNRHTFNAKHARTSSKELSIQAVNLMKDMNMNAVRMSHYPPDKHFLDVCDSLGLYVLDELCAWQRPSYDDVVGRKLLKEMIDHDVNHPSIIVWDNGNEGGENNNLNDDFAKFDIQKREVLHPWQDFRKTNTLHYIDYSYLAMDGYSKRKIFFPTEFLHGLYDGGHGAGLEDYWLRMWNHPLAAGGFLWVFADEAIERTDRNNELDSDGNHAPDGILGPHLEKEGSFYTIKEVWSPVHFEKRYITPEFNGEFRIQNRFHFTNLNAVKFQYRWLKYDKSAATSTASVLAKGQIDIDLAPMQNGILKVDLTDNWQTADALEISAVDQYNRKLNTWSWPVAIPETLAPRFIAEGLKKSLKVIDENNQLTISTGEMKFVFNKENGILTKVFNANQAIALNNGPLFVSKDKKVISVDYQTNDSNITIRTLLGNKNRPDEFTWTIQDNGLLLLNVNYEPANKANYAGVTFSLPEQEVEGMRWMGQGPYRVWKNRMKGPQFGVWEKSYNNAQTGYKEFDYPEFKGYYAETYWVKVMTKQKADFKVFVESNDVFMRMLTPEFSKDSRGASAPFPKGDLSFLHTISSIGTKFKDAEATGPMAQPAIFRSNKIHGGKLNIKLTFDFR
ncbi:beta-galactosidase [Prolixibacteraceae bacterium JC049]|nr:beta-galactosidase [Prolixibacteraceae bacterium JC049]